jgi:hypothetical protein
LSTTPRTKHHRNVQVTQENISGVEGRTWSNITIHVETFVLASFALETKL